MRRLLFPLLIVLGVGAWLYFGRYYNPEKAFATFQQAVTEKKWPTVMASMTPESQNRAIGTLIGATAFASIRHPEASDILTKHGIEKDDLLKGLAGAAILNPTRVLDALSEKSHEHAASVANKPAFLRDAVNCLEGIGTNTDSFFNKVATTQLTNVKTDGDTATGTLSIPIGHAGSTIYFRRVDRRWLIDL